MKKNNYTQFSIISIILLIIFSIICLPAFNSVFSDDAQQEYESINIDFSYLNNKSVGGSFVLRGVYENLSPDHVGHYARDVFLRKEGVRIAKAKIAFMGTTNESFSLSSLFWQDVNSHSHIANWNNVLSENETAEFDLVVEMSKLPRLKSESFTVTLQNDLTVELKTPNQQFPATYHSELEVFAESSINGGTSPYTYTWNHCQGEYDYTFPDSSESSITIKYGQLKQWGAIPLTFHVTDSLGNIAFAQKIIVIDKLYESGNPSINGSGSQLVQGVNVSNGNFHLSATDMFVPSKGISFALMRAYNSSPEFISGRKWHFNYDMKLIYRMFKGLRQVYIVREDGRIQDFYQDIDGQWYPMNAGSFDKLIQNENQSFSLYTKGSIVYHFNPPENKGIAYLEKIADRDGNELSLYYIREGENEYAIDVKINMIVDSCNREYTFEYSENGNLEKVSDFTGRNVQYIYDNKNRLTLFQDVREKTTTYFYKEIADKPVDFNLLIGIQDPRKNKVLTINYDDQNRVASITNALDKTTSFVYGYFSDNSKGTVVVMPIKTSSIAYKFDTKGIIIETIDWLSYQESENIPDYEHSEFLSYTQTVNNISLIPEKTLLTKSINKKGYQTAYEYYAQGNIKSVKDILNRTFTFKWNINEDSNDPLTRNNTSEQINLSLLEQVHTPGQKINHFKYSPTGNIEKLTNPLNESIQFIYKDAGLIDHVLDAKQYKTTMEYDDYGNVKRVTDPYLNYIEYDYNDLGLVTKVTDKRGNSTEYEYDKAGNVTKTIDAKKNETSYEYDSNNNLIEIEDPKGNRTEFSYNSLNLLETISVKVDGQKYSKRYEYDEMNRVSSVFNENNHESLVNYDPRGRVLEEINPLSAKISYTYDINDNVITITDAENHIMTYTYDKLDRVVEVSDHLGNTIAYEYDIEGRIKKRTDPRNFTTEYTYDDAGRLREVKDSNQKITYADYDENGNLRSVCDPNGYTTYYVYDKLNRLEKMIDPKNREWTYKYDENSNLTDSITHDNRKTTLEYDERNQVIKVTHFNENGEEIDSVEYEYDENGNRTKMIDKTGKTEYKYDELDRLVRVTDAFNHSIQYYYDGVGNIKNMMYPNLKTVFYTYDDAERLKTVTDWLNRKTTYDYNKNDQPISIFNGNNTTTKISYDLAGRLNGYTNMTSDNEIISSHAYQYDQNGNIVQMNADLPILPEILSKKTDMTYDSANQILTSNSSTFEHDKSGRLITQIIGQQTTHYSYNALDLIASITAQNYSAIFDYNGDGHRIVKTINGEKTGYIVDPNDSLPNVISETDADNQINYNYIYGLGLISQIDHENNQRFYHFDSTGHTIALSDEGEKILDKYAYTPYGETTVNGDGYNPFRYVGKYGVIDDGNGLLYMRARYYLVKIKRFAIRDSVWGSILNPQTYNNYSYVVGSPLKGIDPHGLFTLSDYSFTFDDSKEYFYELSAVTGKMAGKLIGEIPKRATEGGAMILKTANASFQYGQHTSDVVVFYIGNQVFKTNYKPVGMKSRILYIKKFNNTVDKGTKSIAKMSENLSAKAEPYLEKKVPVLAKYFIEQKLPEYATNVEDTAKRVTNSDFTTIKGSIKGITELSSGTLFIISNLTNPCDYGNAVFEEEMGQSKLIKKACEMYQWKKFAKDPNMINKMNKLITTTDSARRKNWYQEKNCIDATSQFYLGTDLAE